MRKLVGYPLQVLEESIGRSLGNVTVALTWLSLACSVRIDVSRFLPIVKPTRHFGSAANQLDPHGQVKLATSAEPSFCELQTRSSSWKFMRWARSALFGRATKKAHTRYARKARRPTWTFWRSAADVTARRSSKVRARDRLPLSLMVRVLLRIITCTSPDSHGPAECLPILARCPPCLSRESDSTPSPSQEAHTAHPPMHPDNRCSPIISKLT